MCSSSTPLPFAGGRSERPARQRVVALRCASGGAAGCTRIRCIPLPRSARRGLHAPSRKRRKTRTPPGRRHGNGIKRDVSFSETVLGRGFSHHPHFTAFKKQKRSTMLIGYARVSIADQNLALQHQALSAAGCEKIFEDAISSAKIDRPGLTKAQEQLCPGGTLVVWKLDRLGRTVNPPARLAEWSHNWLFRWSHEPGRKPPTVVPYSWQATLSAARAKGHLPGRKRLMTDSKIASAIKLLEAGTAPVEVARHRGVSIPTLYRRAPANGTS